LVGRIAGDPDADELEDAEDVDDVPLPVGSSGSSRTEHSSCSHCTVTMGIEHLLAVVMRSPAVRDDTRCVVVSTESVDEYATPALAAICCISASSSLVLQ